jgi:hypothetical protein
MTLAWPRIDLVGQRLGADGKAERQACDTRSVPGTVVDHDCHGDPAPRREGVTGEPEGEPTWSDPGRLGATHSERLCR